MTDKAILITRPKGDESELAETLHAHGYRVIHEPLMEIFLLHTQRAAMDLALRGDPDAIIVTSRHGVQALALLTELRDPMLLCVGEATARTAESMGFTRVAAAGGNVQSLMDYILAAYEENTRFLYICGEHVRADIDRALTAKGMQALRIVAYQALAAETLSDTLIEQLKRGRIDGVTLFSKRTSQIFMRLLQRAQISPELLQAFALSEAVAGPLLETKWRGVHVAKQPTLASMLDCVDNAYLSTHR